MKRQLKVVCHLLITLCLIFSAAACSGKADSAAAKPQESTGPKYAGETLNLLLSAGSYCESLEPIIKEFEKVYPGVTVNYDLLGRSNSDERTIIELSSNSDAHDVYYVYGESLMQFTGNDWLEPLDDYIADKSITNDSLLQLSDFSEGPLEACRYQGKLYGLPIFSSTCIMYYRTDYFEQAGIAGPPKTWDELVEACKKLDAIGVQPLGMRGAKAFGGAGWHLPMLTHAFGGKIYKDYPVDYHPTVNEKPFVEAIQFYSDLLRNYGIKGATTCNYEDIILAVQQGTVGIWIDGAPLVKQYVDPVKSKSAGKIGFSVIPAGRTGVQAAQTIHLVAVGKGSKHKKLAWEFLQWATSHDVLIRLAVDGTHVAIPKSSVLNDPQFIKVNNFGDGAWASAFSECLAKAAKDYYPLTKDFPEVSDIITASLSEVFTGKSAQIAMDEANRKIDTLMKQEGYY